MCETKNESDFLYNDYSGYKGFTTAITEHTQNQNSASKKTIPHTLASSSRIYIDNAFEYWFEHVAIATDGSSGERIQ